VEVSKIGYSNKFTAGGYLALRFAKRNNYTAVAKTQALAQFKSNNDLVSYLSEVITDASLSINRAIEIRQAKFKISSILSPINSVAEPLPISLKNDNDGQPFISIPKKDSTSFIGINKIFFYEKNLFNLPPVVNVDYEVGLYMPIEVKMMSVPFPRLAIFLEEGHSRIYITSKRTYYQSLLALVKKNKVVENYTNKLDSASSVSKITLNFDFVDDNSVRKFDSFKFSIEGTLEIFWTCKYLSICTIVKYLIFAKSNLLYLYFII